MLRLLTGSVLLLGLVTVGPVPKADAQDKRGFAPGEYYPGGSVKLPMGGSSGTRPSWKSPKKGGHYGSYYGHGSKYGYGSKYGRGNYGRDSFGRGNSGRGDFRRDDFGRGKSGRGDFGRGNSGRGNSGRGSRR